MASCNDEKEIESRKPQKTEDAEGALSLEGGQKGCNATRGRDAGVAKHAKKEMKERKRALCIATVASNLDNFNRGNVELLKELGYEVTLAANFNAAEDSSPKEKLDAFASEMMENGVKIRQIDFSRHPGHLRQQLKSIRQVRKLLKENHYDLIHCHTPIASVITRAEANRYRKRNGTRVIYTAHGFHFFQGAPKKNWLIYYPLEKWASRFTDTLITINEEDERLAREKLRAREVVRIPGIGVDTERFQKAAENAELRERKRRELGLSENDLVMISVGELNRNKNHALAIRGLSEAVLHSPELSGRLTYLLCGQGELRPELERLADDLGMGSIVKVLGYREDIMELLSATDLFLFPSLREGLPLSLLEAMAAGLPAVVTDTRGNRDLIRNGENGFVTGFDEKEFGEKTGILLRDRDMRNAMRKKNLSFVERYDMAIVREKMREVYRKKVGVNKSTA